MKGAFLIIFQLKVRVGRCDASSGSSRGEVLFGLGVAFVALGAAILQAELRAESQSEFWITASVAIAALGLLLLGATVIEHFRHRHDSEEGTANPCGDPKVRLNRIKGKAKHLEHELAHFHNWWPAVESDGFDGELPDGRPATHAKAMQALLWAFGSYFSASYTYEDHCTGYHGRRQRKLLKRLDAVYNALGLNPDGDTDVPLDSGLLHTIGQQSTKRWEEAEARPMSEADFAAELNGNPSFAGHFALLGKLLMAAGPGTPALSRLEKTQEAVKHVKEELS
jgi:hypothetical protein